MCGVHPRVKCAAREGHWRGLKGTSGSSNTHPCAGGAKVPISPFRPYQRLPAPPKPQGRVPSALAVPRGLVGKGPAQRAALFRLHRTDEGLFATKCQFHGENRVKSCKISRKVPRRYYGAETAPPFAQGPSSQVPWARLRRWARVLGVWGEQAVSGTTPAWNLR